MNNIWFYPIISVLIISMASLVGLITFGIKQERLRKILIYFISFSAGALFGDAFIHLLPETIRESGFGVFTALSVLSGILIFFILEKFVCWQHCHMPITKTHIHNFAYMNLVGDSLHNFIDGLIIAASYIVSIPLGIATTIAVFFHEIPQEIGDFGVLLHGGFARGKALLMNFLTALVAVAGTIIGLLLRDVSGIQRFLIPFAIGGFIYVAGSDLIPELHKETDVVRSAIQVVSFVAGILVMLILLWVG